MKKTILLTGLFAFIGLFGFSQTNDIKMQTFWVTNNYVTPFNSPINYSKIPQRQAQNLNMGFSAKYKNTGTTILPNTRLNLQINGPSSYLDVGISSPKNIRVDSTDSNSIIRSNYNLKAGKGLYQIQIFPTTDSVLTNNGDDTLKFPLIVSDTTFARDNDNGRAASVVYYNPTVTQQYEVGAYYELAELDTISSVSFYMDDANTRRSIKEGLIQCHIYRAIVGANGVQKIQNTPLFSSKKVKISDLKIPSAGGWITMGVDRNGAGLGDTLNSGGLIVAYVADQALGKDTIFLSLEGRGAAQSQYYIRQEQGGTWGNWSDNKNRTYIRLNVKPSCPTLNGSHSTVPTSSCGSSTGMATAINPTNGKNPFRYAWSLPGTPTSQTINSLKSGQYQLTITDSNNCNQVQDVYISDSNSLSIYNINVSDVKCAGKPDGKICFNINAGSNGPGYNISWFDKNGTQLQLGGALTKVDSCLESLSTGVYTVLIEDAGSPPCKVFQTFELTGTKSPLAISNEVIKNLNCNGDSSGSISIEPSGGTNPLSVIWPGSVSGDTISKLSAGAYSVTVTDSNNCTISKSFTVTEPNAIVIGFGTVDSTSTPGQVKITPTFSGGTPGYSHSWKNSSGQVCQSNSTTGEIVIGKGAGSNQENSGCYTIHVQDSLSCSMTKQYCVDLKLSIFNNTSKSAFEVIAYPNPNNGKFNVSVKNILADTYSIEIFNLLGEVILNEKQFIRPNYEGTFNINSKGIYIMKISNGTNSEMIQIVVE